MTRRALFITTLIVISIIGLIAAAVVNNINKEEALKKNSIRDRDTGSVVRTGTTGSQENAGESLVTLFGTGELQDKGMSIKQVQSLYKSIQNYSLERLKDAFASLTIRPQDLVVADGVYSSNLRLGQGDKLLPISIKTSGDSVIITISDSSKEYGGDFLGLSSLPYKNSLFSLNLSTDSSADQPPIIVVTAPEGYRNGAISKMKEFGYNTADLQFVFSGYEDPFKS